ncbi:L,D-transpeptidase [Rhodovulum sulfidophilum]|uniref:L,D-transpeptidase n=1 Tax=Rhodovulum visakhapatnamense TaxID=364297 RepID=A0A4R8G2H4_9RHOB|nr:L,D-transpeptidase [Rhodovulum visakhapatnamense]MBL3568138.1 L,D-transpeptidase [Rhodovulum visakhapatnamense]MBL3578669.1 L,D-transpeptidase [Rhodovulum visakhapatnamense]OLS45328.1 L,D-transpeptidase [Rhodovulum sulfidophilum]TDX29287.1 lipoprotein-anchoring transpeptidase ErfK/SrfK [Rhodovulum visakhapatnamense]
MADRTFSRRAALVTLGAGLGAPALLRAEPAPMARRNISSFARQDWRDHFDGLGTAVIVADTSSRALHFWSGDGSDYRIYPTSVPISEELTKRGYTKVVRKKIGPDWTPTPSMVERNPDLRYMPPGPDNPLGTHAMYLSWPAYLIHGTHDTRKIGRPSSDGCIGLYNDMIAELYDIAPIGTRVRII